MRLDPLPKGVSDPETERMLGDALEYEGWQEADTLYAKIHASLQAADAKLRARALMDHARVLRQLEKEPQAMEMEARAEEIVGEPIEREAAPKSSVEQLKESQEKKPGLFGRLFKGR